MKTFKRLQLIMLHPGAFFPEYSNKIVENTDIPSEIPYNCYGFYFTETEIATDGKKEFIGGTNQISKIYVIGEEIHVDNIPLILNEKDTDILRSNIRNNSPTKTGIKTHLGNWQFVTENTVVLSPSQFKFIK